LGRSAPTRAKEKSTRGVFDNNNKVEGKAGRKQRGRPCRTNWGATLIGKNETRQPGSGSMLRDISGGACLETAQKNQRRGKARPVTSAATSALLLQGKTYYDKGRHKRHEQGAAAGKVTTLA